MPLPIHIPAMNIYKLLNLFLIFNIIFFNHSLAQEEEHPVADSVVQSAKNSLENNGKVQHLYRMNYWVSGGFSLAATAANVYAIPTIIKSKQQITDAELAALNKNIFSGFDRIALEQNPNDRDMWYKASDYTLPVIVASAAVLGLDKKIQKDWARLLLLYYETHAVTFTLYNFSFFGPAFQNKIRPVSYYTELPTDKRNGGNNRNSMYSGHTASSAAATFFMVKVYSDYHPELGAKKYLLYGLASIPPLAEGFLRVKALAHFPSDVMMGFVIGAACGIAIPSIHHIRNHNLDIGMTGTPVGPGIGLTWHPSYKQPAVSGIVKITP